MFINFDFSLSGCMQLKRSFLLYFTRGKENANFEEFYVTIIQNKDPETFLENFKAHHISIQKPTKTFQKSYLNQL